MPETNPPAIKPTAEFADFERLDIRVGTIVDVQPFPRARTPAYKVEVDFGAAGRRWSSAQITSYAPEQLLGTAVCCIVNFAARNIAGFRSEILILGARDRDGHVILLTPRSEVPAGQPVF